MKVSITSWFMPAEGHPPWRLALLGLVLVLPFVALGDVWFSDACQWYGPMIRDLAESGFLHGFHPMIPPAFVATGALLAMCGMEALRAAMLVSCLFYVITVFPLYGIVRRLWDARTAVWAIFLYLFCPKMLWIGGLAGIDSGKLFFLVLMVYALCRIASARGWGGYVALTIGTAGLALIRGDGILFSAAAFGSAAVLLAAQKQWREFLPLMVATMTSVLMLVPWVAWEYKHTGYPVLDSRQVGAVQKVMKVLYLATPACRNDGKNRMDEKLAMVFPDAGSERQPLQVRQPQVHKKAFKVVRDGILPRLYIPFFLLGLWLTWRRQSGRKSDQKTLLAWFFGHAVVWFIVFHLLMGLEIDERYILPGIPLALGWSAAGILWCLDQVLKRYVWLLLPIYVCMGIGVVVALSKGYKMVLNDRMRQAFAAERQGAEWLRNEGRALAGKPRGILESTGSFYHRGSGTVVMSVRYYGIPFLADVEVLDPEEIGRVMTAHELLAVCRQFGVQFIIWRPLFATVCPDLKNVSRLPPGFRVMCDLRALDPGMSLVIIGVEDNLDGRRMGKKEMKSGI